MAQKTYLGIGDETTTYSKTLSSSDFQQGYYLFASGQTGGESSPNYYRSTNFHSVSYPNAVTVTTEYTLNTDSGFIWYDSNYSYLGSAGSDATPIVSGSSFTATPPVNAAYCKFNINKTNIVSTGVGSVLVKVHSVARNVKNIYVGVDGVAREVKKAYIGDANGLARLCYSAGIPFASGTITTTSASKTLTISDLPFKPTFAVIMYQCNTSNYGGLLGAHGNNIFYDNYGYANVPFSSDVTITYGVNSVTITNIATSSFKNVYFHKGTYSYIILGANTDNENVAYGTQSISYGTNSMTVSGLSFTPNRGMCYFYDSYGSNNYANTAMIRGENLRTVSYQAGDDYYALKEISSSGAITFANGSATFSGTPSYKLTPQRDCTAYYVVWREE